MKNKHFTRKKQFRRDYKITVHYIPDSMDMFVYVYHFKIGFGACFKSINDAKYWMEGFKPNVYGYAGH